MNFHNLVLWNLNLARFDIIADILGTSPINLATHREGCAENLLNGTLQLPRHTLEPHGPGDLNDLVEGNALGVLDVLLLLAVSRGLLEGLDDEGRGGGNDGDLRLTILDRELDSHAESFLEVG